MKTIRLLKFKVDAQRITKDPTCDFTNIIANTVGYLKAEFSFSTEWNDCHKIVSFWRGSKEYALLLNDECICSIPSEVLNGRTFGVSVIGKKKDYRITTNKTTVRQEVN